MENDLIINGEICLYGDVGDVWGDGFTAGDVAAALAILGPGDVTVRINSGGGIATEGMAILSVLMSHPGKVNIIIDGVAASAASLIAMVNSGSCLMRQGAMMMIHDPASITIGNADAHAKAGSFLDKLADNYAGVYARASGKTPADARSIMKAETWLTADEAVAQGFASGTVADAAKAAAAFDYKGVYMRAPLSLPHRVMRLRPGVATAALADLSSRVAVVELGVTAIVATADVRAVAAVRMAMRQGALRGL
jgi:ATP-dependent protease ClpP protease subunit